MDGMVQVYVPAGEFPMGLPITNSSSKPNNPLHTVFLEDFWIDQTEVTNAMFSVFLASSGYILDPESLRYYYHWTDDGYVARGGADWEHPLGADSDISGMEKNPVVQVTWYDAQAYCTWAGKRLPTEAEWEKAARGVDGRKYPWGNDAPTPSLAYTCGDCDLGAWYMAPAGSTPLGVSPYGTLDMAGNAFEWVQDWYETDYYSSQATWNDPQGPEASKYDWKVVRGGDIIYIYPIRIGSADRNYDDPAVANSFTGFRCAASP